MKSRVAQFLEECFWNIYAIAYDVLANLKPYQEMQERVLELLELKPGSHLLDAGCGTGNLLQRIRKRFGNQIELDGCDFSRTMLKRARKKLPDANLWTANFNQSLGTQKSYEKIVTTNVVYILEDPIRFIETLFLLLEPGGILIVVTPHRDMNSWRVISKHIQFLGWRSLPGLIYMFFPLVIVGIANFVIDIRERVGSYNSFDETKLMEIFTTLGNCRMERTYANQALLVLVQKGDVY